jgi:hypothetical protein
MVLRPNLTVRMGHSIAFNGEWAWLWIQSSNDGIYGLPSNLLQLLQLERRKIIYRYQTDSGDVRLATGQPCALSKQLVALFRRPLP